MPDRPASEQASGSSGLKATKAPFEGLAGLRVLLVDDTEDALETFRYLLEHAGCTVRCAASAQAAIALTDQAEFDLMISDVSMPHMNGYELVAELRNRARTAALPAIALTGHGGAHDVKQAFAAGFQAHVDKPVDFEHMKRVIATVIGAARAGQAPTAS